MTNFKNKFALAYEPSIFFRFGGEGTKFWLQTSWAYTSAAHKSYVNVIQEGKSDVYNEVEKNHPRSKVFSINIGWEITIGNQRKKNTN